MVGEVTESANRELHSLRFSLQYFFIERLLQNVFEYTILIQDCLILFQKFVLLIYQAAFL